MRSWTASHALLPEEQQSILELVAQIGRATFDEAVLDRLNRLFPVGSMSVYRTWTDRQPVLLLSHSFRRPDVTLRCFEAYRHRIYLEDRSFDAARMTAPKEGLSLTHLRADEFPNPEHRELVYARNRVRERLSVARHEHDGSVVSVNLYGHDDHPSYNDRHIGHFESLAPVLFAGIEKHLSIAHAPTRKDAILALPGSETTTSHYQLFFRALDRGLTAREIDVCVRVLQGLTYDGIAADMQLRLPTVITYRNRAFSKLGIRFKNQLFALHTQYRQATKAA